MSNAVVEGWGGSGITLAVEVHLRLGLVPQTEEIGLELGRKNDVQTILDVDQHLSSDGRCKAGSGFNHFLSGQHYINMKEQECVRNFEHSGYT